MALRALIKLLVIIDLVMLGALRFRFSVIKRRPLVTNTVTVTMSSLSTAGTPEDIPMSSYTSIPYIDIRASLSRWGPDHISFILDSEIPANPEPLIVKSLIFDVNPNVDDVSIEQRLVLLVLRNNRVVATDKLRIPAQIASRARAEQTTGCKVGTIAPLPTITNMRVIFDQALFDGDDHQAFVYGGCGEEGYSMRLTVESLHRIVQQIDTFEIADFAVARNLRSDSPKLAKTSNSPTKAPAIDNSRGPFSIKSLRYLAMTQRSPAFFAQLARYDALGDDKPPIDATPPDSGKSALHLAAWRGPEAHIRALLERGASINAWSTGSGNYGKTPIFYAITRSRDDVVMLLLGLNAEVSIVNNKGQTPLSLAFTHLKESTIAAIEAAELSEASRHELQYSHWKNFWVTHRDGRLYGDLDPRFVDPFDPILQQLAQNSDEIRRFMTQEETSELNSLSEVVSGQHKSLLSMLGQDRLPEQYRGRVLLPTTLELRLEQIQRIQDALEAEATSSPKQQQPDESPTKSDRKAKPRAKTSKGGIDVPVLVTSTRSLQLELHCTSDVEATAISSIGEDGLLEFTAVVASIRNIGKYLMFASALPLSYIQAYSTKVSASKAALAAHPQDDNASDQKGANKMWYDRNVWGYRNLSNWGSESDRESEGDSTLTPFATSVNSVAIQLMIGNTMKTLHGEDTIRHVCKQLRVARVVRVRGTFSLETSASRENALDKQTLDFIVHKAEFLETPHFIECLFQSNGTDNDLATSALGTLSTNGRKRKKGIAAANEIIPLTAIQANEVKPVKLLATSVVNIPTWDVAFPSDDSDTRLVVDTLAYVADDASVQALKAHLVELMGRLDGDKTITVGWKLERSSMGLSALTMYADRKAWLLDLFALFPSPNKNSTDIDTSAEVAMPEHTSDLADILKTFFTHPNVMVTGFAPNRSIKRLQRAFSSVHCFSRYSNILAIDQFLDQLSAYIKTHSLAAIGESVLGWKLPKVDEFDWTLRPMSSTQMAASVIEASASVHVLEKLSSTAAALGASDRFDLVFASIVTQGNHLYHYLAAEAIVVGDIVPTQAAADLLSVQYQPPQFDLEDDPNAPQEALHIERLVLVNNIASLELFHQLVQHEMATQPDQTVEGHRQYVPIGLDCEWPPYAPSDGSGNRVALLQLSTRKNVFLVDLHVLLGPQNCQLETMDSIEDGTETSTMTAEAQLLSDTLSLLFTDDNTLILGFAISGDLKFLHRSYPYIPAFRAFNQVIDLGVVGATLYDKKAVASLTKLSNQILGRTLNKAQQCSDWAARPLTSQQMIYAALDAVVLVRIFDRLLRDTEALAPTQLKSLVISVIMVADYNEK